MAAMIWHQAWRCSSEQRKTVAKTAAAAAFSRLLCEN
jgi:hypothetical protein